jgi:hypothetical protein
MESRGWGGDHAQNLTLQSRCVTPNTSESRALLVTERLCNIADGRPYLLRKRLTDVR